MKQRKPLYEEAIIDKPVVPQRLAGTTIELEGETLEIVAALDVILKRGSEASLKQASGKTAKK